MRGLKSQNSIRGVNYVEVALHVSAWIEIQFVLNILFKSKVALHVSAWIEIIAFEKTHPDGYCRTPCECVD